MWLYSFYAIKRTYCDPFDVGLILRIIYITLHNKVSCYFDNQIN